MLDIETNKQAWEFCDEILPLVSRSFALIIPQCPPPIDRALCVAYLLCRVADTIEDEPSLNEPQRAILYDDFLAAVLHSPDESRVAKFQTAWPARVEGDYGRLIDGVQLVFQAFTSLPNECREPIRKCVQDMIAGMRENRPGEAREGIAFFCRDLHELDIYCHHVAGTVGIMSTALFEMRFRENGFVATAEWRENGRRLGLGLQMTNIIKDFRVDAARGVSFVPLDYVDLSRKQLNSRRDELMAHALGHLDAGLQYVLAVSGGEIGIRSFLLGSIFPALATLDAAAKNESDQPKMSRAQMINILEFIRDHVGDNAAVGEWYREQRNQIISAAAK